MTDFYPSQLVGFNSLELAFIGDGVYELLTRRMLIESGPGKVGKLHTRCSAFVCAGAQAGAARRIAPLLSPEETEIFARAKNARPKTFPKSCNAEDYLLATALEALFGWLYLLGREDRISELFGLCVKV